ADGRLVAGEEIGIRIDEILDQDITGTAAMQEFEAMQLGRVRCKVAVVFGDHNVLQVSEENTEDHQYLATAARKYGMWWAKPGSGIGHQIHQEHFACPGDTALGADSHTPHIGAELGASTSMFPSDGITRDYMRRIGREKDWREVLPDPDADYDETMDLDLSAIEPLVALPSNPDKVVPIGQAEGVKVDQVMVG